MMNEMVMVLTMDGQSAARRSLIRSSSEEGLQHKDEGDMGDPKPGEDQGRDDRGR